MSHQGIRPPLPIPNLFDPLYRFLREQFNSRFRVRVQSNDERSSEHLRKREPGAPAKEGLGVGQQRRQLLLDDVDALVCALGLCREVGRKKGGVG